MSKLKTRIRKPRQVVSVQRMVRPRLLCYVRYFLTLRVEERAEAANGQTRASGT